MGPQPAWREHAPFAFWLVPEPERNLFVVAPDRTAQTQMRDAYSRLGSAISLQMRADMQSAALGAEQTR
jgi:hypothetical protein